MATGLDPTREVKMNFLKLVFQVSQGSTREWIWNKMLLTECENITTYVYSSRKWTLVSRNKIACYRVWCWLLDKCRSSARFLSSWTLSGTNTYKHVWNPQWRWVRRARLYPQKWKYKLYLTGSSSEPNICIFLKLSRNSLS